MTGKNEKQEIMKAWGIKKSNGCFSTVFFTNKDRADQHRYRSVGSLGKVVSVEIREDKP